MINRSFSNKKPLWIGWLLATTLILIPGISIGEASTGPTPRHEIQISTDNDFFIPVSGTDRYYTFGQRITFRLRAGKAAHGLRPLIQSRNTESGIKLTEYEFGMEAFTPGNPHAKKAAQYDRPFAGWSYLAWRAAFIGDQGIIRVGAEIGMVGPASGAGRVQDYFHAHISRDDVLEGWMHQLRNRPGFNITAGYIRSLVEQPYAQLVFENSLKIGNQATFLQSGGRLRLGWFNPLDNTLSYGSTIAGPGNVREIFFDLAFHYRISLVNGTLEGPEGSAYRYPGPQINNMQSRYSGGLHVNTPRFGWSLQYYLIGGELNNLEMHPYGSVDLLFRF